MVLIQTRLKLAKSAVRTAFKLQMLKFAGALVFQAPKLELGR